MSKELFDLSHSGREVLTAERSNVRRSSSPRSTASKIDGESGYPSTCLILRPSASRRIFGTSASRAPSPVPPSTSGAPPDRRPPPRDGHLAPARTTRQKASSENLDEERTQWTCRA